MNKIILISITTFYARQIFDKTKVYEFRKSPLNKELLNEKIYVYSAKKDKAIIGYFRVSNILCGNINEILKYTVYDLREDGKEIIDYFGENNTKCYALHIYDVNKFKKPLTLDYMKSVFKNISMPQYIKYIKESNPLYNIIKNWDNNYNDETKL